MIFDFLPEHSHYLDEIRIENNRKQINKIFIWIAIFIFWFVMGWLTSSFIHWRKA